MYSYLVQDWITLRLDAAQTTITQSELDWMSFQPYQDIVFWLEVRGVLLAGADSISLAYETAPAKDESLFLPMVAAEVLTTGTPTAPQIKKVLLSQVGAGEYPLARWVRWKLTVNGVPDPQWGLTFRIHCAANAVGVL